MSKIEYTAFLATPKSGVSIFNFHFYFMFIATIYLRFDGNN